ncbi:MAG TPA: LLM class F420-dependent oxidoreductase [Acidimicrobiales bacterium]|jgi:alkanesulfonate monooxygenase|nr:LLM class F420-dependent oxidoreductase [Acidimicrobiales bacterium]
MDLRIFTEPHQGASYDTLLEVALEAERCGFDAFFRSDHFLHMGPMSGLPGPTDAWVTLGAIARETTRIRLGTLMTAGTFRLPGPLAIAVAQVDAMSGGRIELGIGTGWFANEHAAYGIPFPSVAERFDRFEEQLQIITGLWKTPLGETFSFKGEYYELVDSPALPKPVQRPHPPILIGGFGLNKTPRLAARYADEFNVVFRDAEVTAGLFARVRDACERDGRSASSIVMSAAQVLCVGENEAEVARRVARIQQDVPKYRRNGLAGTVSEVIDKIGAFREIGTSRLYLEVLDLTDLDHLRLVAEQVMPAIA